MILDILYGVVALVTAAVFYLAWIDYNEKAFPSLGIDGDDRVIGTFIAIICGTFWPVAWVVVGLAFAFRSLERYVKKLRAIRAGAPAWPPPCSETFSGLGPDYRCIAGVEGHMGDHTDRHRNYWSSRPRKEIR